MQNFYIIINKKTNEGIFQTFSSNFSKKKAKKQNNNETCLVSDKLGCKEGRLQKKKCNKLTEAYTFTTAQRAPQTDFNSTSNFAQGLKREMLLYNLL